LEGAVVCPIGRATEGAVVDKTGSTLGYFDGKLDGILDDVRVGASDRSSLGVLVGNALPNTVGLSNATMLGISDGFMVRPDVAAVGESLDWLVGVTDARIGGSEVETETARVFDDVIVGPGDGKSAGVEEGLLWVGTLVGPVGRIVGSLVIGLWLGENVGPGTGFSVGMFDGMGEAVGV